MERTIEHSKLLTVEQVAELLAVTPAWVYQHQHELPFTRLGSGPKAILRMDRADLRSYLLRDERDAACTPRGPRVSSPPLGAALTDKVRVDGLRRLQAGGFVLVTHLDGRLLWAHPDHPERSFWTPEALAELDADQGPRAAA